LSGEMLFERVASGSLNSRKQHDFLPILLHRECVAYSLLP
jgi:hypothetical protein